MGFVMFYFLWKMSKERKGKIGGGGKRRSVMMNGMEGFERLD